jgi:hypothetical protein
MTYHNIYNHKIEYAVFQDKFNTWIEEYQLGGSGYIFDRIEEVRVEVAKINSLRGGTFIETPFKSNMLVNVKNFCNMCFYYVMSAFFFPAKKMQIV